MRGSHLNALYALLVAMLAVLILSVLTGCVKKGVVVDKDYDPAYTTYMVQTIGKSTTMQPIFHGESWRLKLEDGDETGWVSVDETTYHEYEVGDYYGGGE